MQSILWECRWLYNTLLEQRKTAYEERQESLTYYGQKKTIPELKASRQSLTKAHSQTLQDVVMRLDLAFQAFFRRVKKIASGDFSVKAGEKEVGYPRFKGADRYDSFCYPQYDNGVKLEGDVLSLSKIGQVRMVLHRPIKGEVKTVCIHRQAGHWYACFSVECESEPLPKSDETVGIDVGLNDFAFFSTGESIPNPRFYRKDEKDLKRVQRKVSKLSKGSIERRKAKKALCKVHRRISDRRKNFAHQRSREIVNRFGTICVEDITVNRMVHNHCLAKSIMDAAWSQFFQYLTYKAECADRDVQTGSPFRRLVKVNPAYTSQDCHKCGHRQKMPLSARQYDCPCCGLSISRDWNASLNILRLGLQSLASA